MSIFQSIPGLNELRDLIDFWKRIDSPEYFLLLLLISNILWSKASLYFLNAYLIFVCDTIVTCFVVEVLAFLVLNWDLIIITFLETCHICSACFLEFMLVLVFCFNVVRKPACFIMLSVLPWVNVCRPDEMLFCCSSKNDSVSLPTR